MSDARARVPVLPAVVLAVAASLGAVASTATPASASGTGWGCRTCGYSNHNESRLPIKV